MTAIFWPPRRHDDRLQVPDWQDLGRCLEIGDPDLWFPDKGGPTEGAKEVCRPCEVRDQCLAYALEHRIRHGVWGGKSERQRRRMLARAARYGVAA